MQFSNFFLHVNLICFLFFVFFYSHPVPDYYVLHLEIIGNRTSAAELVRCDAQDPAVPRCPTSYKDGDRYLKWDINKKCESYSVSKGFLHLLEIVEGLYFYFSLSVCVSDSFLLNKIPAKQMNQLGRVSLHSCLRHWLGPY